MIDGVTDDDANLGEEHEHSRRAFLKRMAALAFAVPVISSFHLDAFGSSSNRSAYPRQAYPNGEPPVGTFSAPYAWFGYEGIVEETVGLENETFSYAYYPNQFTPYTY